MGKRQMWMRQLRLSLMFAAVMFILLFATMAVVSLFMVLTVHFGLFAMEEINRLPLFIFAVSSVIIGTVMALLFSHKPLKPLRIIMDALPPPRRRRGRVHLRTAGTPGAGGDHGKLCGL